MEILTNNIAIIAAKPLTGATVGVSAAVLTYLGFLSAIFGCVAALVGLIAACYSLAHQYRIYKADEKHFKTPRK